MNKITSNVLWFLAVGLAIGLVVAASESSKRRNEKTQLDAVDHDLALTFGLTTAEIEKDRVGACQVIVIQLASMEREADTFLEVIPEAAKGQDAQMQRLAANQQALKNKLSAARGIEYKHAHCL